MEEFEPESWAATIGSAQAVLVLTSTYGPGAPPGTAAKFVAWLQSGGDDVKDVFEGGLMKGASGGIYMYSFKLWLANHCHKLGSSWLHLHCSREFASSCSGWAKDCC